ncbi:Asp23/Gls24 family envelope stress response protein [Phaeacidiphilus oryzae]|uniref:Asp23/Gls24 family envelope stress response protein n=1 Tax=Phaeacidiphilus oryzae TaxID=348818 RepID=UPI0007C7C30D|nr:Asp23/Gls24 family envelope stress response protein [Phaeacidiphilus oryzae]
MVAAAGPAAVPVAERGATAIADRVLKRIAAQAAREPLPPGRATAATAWAGTRRGRVRIALNVRLPYPIDIEAMCAALHDHVRERTAELTGLPVAKVTVRVDRLSAGRAPFPFEEGS